MHRLIVVIVLLCVQNLNGLPMMPGSMMPMYDVNFQTRGPLDFIGNWIQSSQWFPIEINVPDTIAGIGQGVATGWTNLQNGWSNFMQNLPFFNRFPQQRPPQRIIVLMPKKTNRPNFNTFQNDIAHFDIYP